jgi:hypothetical protein
MPETLLTKESWNRHLHTLYGKSDHFISKYKPHDTYPTLSFHHGGIQSDICEVMGSASLGSSTSDEHPVMIAASRNKDRSV